MQARLDAWANKGGKKDRLWDAVKTAQRREGVVVHAPDAVILSEDRKDMLKPVISSGANRVNRDVQRLNELLDSVVKLREEIKKGLEVVVWRERLLELATERGEQLSQCGWDQRLCFGDEEWAEYGAGVLESYDDTKHDENSPNGESNSGGVEGFGAWWCPGKEKCDRHVGWQSVRYRDICNEKEQKEDALHNLTTKERELRKRIEDLYTPHAQVDSTAAPLKLANSKLNGYIKATTNGTSKKVKKRKVPA